MNFDHYFDYAEVTDFCRALEERYPGLARLTSIGKTYEGREIWALEMTDPATGLAEDKAAFLMDGNIHSMELTSSMAVLYAAESLLAGYGTDPAATRYLKEYTVYAIPRINCDGAELCLKTPYSVRGSVEQYYDPSDGAVPEDINCDGEILLMRIEDPAGNWKVSKLDPRIMEKRGPFDTEGTFYRVLPEGTVRGDDRISPKPAQPREGLDPNREFPFEWSEKTMGEGKNPVSGPEPLYDAEVKALYNFILAHPNLAFVQNFHTYGGFHISPAAFCPHLELPDGDAAAIRAIGRDLSAATGYVSEGIFPQGARDIAPGSYTTWLYFERGIMAWCTELWNFHRQADPNRPANWSMFFVESQEQFEREETMALKWDEERNGGRGFMPWTAFLHPQLGKVEIGGWREKFTKWNPPVAHLEGVARKARACAMASLACLARLSVEISQVAGENETYTVEAAIANAGYLPTSATAKAVEKELAGDLTATLTGAECVTEATVKLGSLDGYSRVRAVWTVREKPGATIRVTARAARAGIAYAEQKL